jgi:predicted MFS family arabinose efflux permease
MALCCAVLIASEFMPVSLLSPIAHDLHLTEGQAGQAISISGLFAVITSLSIARMAGRFDRRLILLGLTALLAVSGAIVAFAMNFMVLMTGRALLGVAIGGFWSMSAATIMRLVPADAVPRGLAIIYGGNALASTISAPLGSFLGGLIGWRGAFFLVVPLAIVAITWQALTLPALPGEDNPDAGKMLHLLKNQQVSMGMLAVMLLFMGQFALFTYLRPFLEGVTGVGVTGLSAMLLVIGAAGLVGTSFVGEVLKTRLHTALTFFPVSMALIAVALAAFGKSPWITAILLAIWGLVSTAAPVAWSTWLTRTLPNDAEAGGGLMVAIIQFAITVGATAGGVVFDARGPIVEFMGSGFILAVAGVVAYAASHLHARSGRVDVVDEESGAVTGSVM